MVTCDVARAVLVCVMALVSLKAPPVAALWIMVALLFLVTLLDSPFKSARSATLPDVLSGDRYVLGIAISQTTLQIGMVSGFALGGIVVAATGVRPALLVDAARSPPRRCWCSSGFGSAPSRRIAPPARPASRRWLPACVWCSGTAGSGR